MRIECRASAARVRRAAGGARRHGWEWLQKSSAKVLNFDTNLHALLGRLSGLGCFIEQPVIYAEAKVSVKLWLLRIKCWSRVGAIGTDI